MTATYRCKLTKAHMDAVHDEITSDPAEGWVNAVVYIFKLFGVDLTDPDQPQISASDYAIPRDQWATICQWIIDVDRRDDITRVNHGLDFMNFGPSSYDPVSP